MLSLKCQKLTLRFVEPFEIAEKVEVVVYQIALHEGKSNGISK